MDDPLESRRIEREQQVEDLSRTRLDRRSRNGARAWSGLALFGVAWAVLATGGIIATALSGNYQPAFATIVWGWLPAAIFAVGQTNRRKPRASGRDAPG